MHGGLSLPKAQVRDCLYYLFLHKKMARKW